MLGGRKVCNGANEAWFDIGPPEPSHKTWAQDSGPPAVSRLVSRLVSLLVSRRVSRLVSRRCSGVPSGVPLVF